MLLAVERSVKIKIGLRRKTKWRRINTGNEKRLFRGRFGKKKKLVQKNYRDRKYFYGKKIQRRKKTNLNLFFFFFERNRKQQKKVVRTQKNKLQEVYKENPIWQNLVILS